ncbi:Brp/Blh family beta-carotene 15,15'-dioxygenase [Hymenobacter sp.]|jgi:Brp/Blh family beta-carotene 15,15'-monooxygenase|uniref:Brp/Blh family beta-carotene 15,15'-dioxygenase n=1 Tax=Hymenobacter sp. TaxID=1898978 RepID=UPI002ED7738E
MLATPTPVPRIWPQRRYSYVAVLTLTAMGVAFPTQAWVLLGLPLAVGMVLLGVAHGACDQLVVPAVWAGSVATSRLHYWLRFLVGYLGLAAVIGLLWWWWPAAMVGLFFLLTVWHWGSADAPPELHSTPIWWLMHSLLRGLLLFLLPLWRWPIETADIVDGLLGFAGAPAVSQPLYERTAALLGSIVLVGHVILWIRYLIQRKWAVLGMELVEVLLLTGLLVALPPMLSVGVYFVFWHSLQHVLRLTQWLGYPAPVRRRTAWVELGTQLRFFLRRAAPLLTLSCVGLLIVGCVLAPQLPDATAWFSFALVAASIVTLPHALLVTLVMDAAHRQPVGSGH